MMYLTHSAWKRASKSWFSRNPSTNDIKPFVSTNFLCSRYPKTKLLEVYAVRQLASLLPVSEHGVIVNAVSPGLCYSELDRNAGTGTKLILSVMRKLLARTAEEGSRNLLQAAFAGPESHGTYCSECQVKECTFTSFSPLAP